MGQERIDAVASAMDKVEHTFRKAGFFQQLDQHHDGQRNFLARFQHESISTRDREWKHPHRHHRGKVERRDPDADAERLIQRLAINPACQIFQRIAEEQRWNAARIFDILDPAIGAAARFSQRLSMLARYAFADAIEVFLDELAVAEKHSCPLHRRRFAPGRKRRRGCFHGFIHHVRATHRRLADCLAARRIKDRRRRAIGDIPPLTADEDRAGKQ